MGNTRDQNSSNPSMRNKHRRSLINYLVCLLMMMIAVVVVHDEDDCNVEEYSQMLAFLLDRVLDCELIVSEKQNKKHLREKYNRILSYRFINCIISKTKNRWSIRIIFDLFANKSIFYSKRENEKIKSKTLFFIDLLDTYRFIFESVCGRSIQVNTRWPVWLCRSCSKAINGFA